MSATHYSAALTPAGRIPTRFSVRRLGERLAVVNAGEWLDEERARAFARCVLRTTQEGVRELVLDLSKVRHHAWPSIYALCELEARLSEACCEPVSAAASPLLEQDLRAVGLDQTWDLAPTVDEALGDLLARPC
jgi:anti-anti-sigma regulatory factor